MDSWRTYKNSVIYALTTLFPGNTTALETLRNESSADLPKTSGNTSGRKTKQVSQTAWDALQVGLRKRIKDGHRHAHGLLNFLNATLLTGLRPSEWCFSVISIHPTTGRPTLRVKNAKHTNGRANGEYRELYLDGLNEIEMNSIKSALQYCAAANQEGAVRILTALRNELGIVRNSAIVGSKKPQSSVTLYSFRHQFIADAKLTFDDPVIIAALVGHSSTKTAFEHYGKRRFSNTRVKVYPTIESVEAVHKVHIETYKKFVTERTTSRTLTL